MDAPRQPAPPRPPAAPRRFGEFTLDPARGVLLGPTGTEAWLRPKTAEVLRRLVDKAGQVVAREELMRAVWPGVFVTDDSITQCVTEIRRALGDEGARLLRTLPKRGYLLAVEPAAAAAAERPDPPPPTPPPAGRASLAVLPFANLSGDPRQDHVADGVTEEVTTALARVRWFNVVAPPRPDLAERGRAAADPRRAGRDLGVRYVLEGSVRRAGDRLRITGQLVEAETGRHIWARTFEGGAEDVFALQDAVAEAVAGAIEPSLGRAEVERARGRPDDAAGLGAYDLCVRAVPLLRAVTPEASAAALELLRRSMALDPALAAAKANALLRHVQRVAQGWALAGEREEGARLARAAFAAHGDDPLALALVADALALLAFDLDGSREAAMRAVALNPNSAWTRNAAGWASNRIGAPEAAIEHFQKAIRLGSPNPEAFCLTGLGYSFLMTDRPGEALALGEQALRQAPALMSGHRVVVAALAWLGRREEAAAAALRLLRHAPKARSDADFRRLYRDQGFAGKLIRAFRDAGLP